MQKPSTEKGVAVLLVLLLLVTLLGLGILAFQNSLLGTKIAGNRSEKVHLENITRSALEIIQHRINERMNAPLVKDDWDWANNEPLKLVMADGDESGGVCNGWNLNGHCWHGYRFQNATNVFDVLDDYVADFQWEDAHSAGAFAPCTKSNGCASSNDLEWDVKLLSAVKLTDAPVRSVDITGDGQDDYGYQIEMEVKAFDEKKGRRTVTRADLLLVAGVPSFQAAIPMAANVVSFMSLYSSFIKGAVVQMMEPTRLPKRSDGSLVPLNYFNLGELGQVNYSCKDQNGFSQTNPCWANATNERFEPERNANFTNGWVGGLITNFDVGSVLNPQLGFGAMGLVVNDNDSGTGDPKKTPPDALTAQDPTLLDYVTTTAVGRDASGQIADNIFDLDEVTNGTLGQTGSSDCIRISTYRSGGGPNGGLGNLSPTIPPNRADDSVILAPKAGCNITLTGTYGIKGDLIIAGDGTGKFQDPGGGAMNGTLLVKGNVYILNNVNTSIGPLEATGADRTIMDNFRAAGAGAWQASQGYPAAGNAFDKLGIVALGHMVVGNLADSNVYSYIMTHANGELNYFNLDLNDNDGVGDLLVPDGYRPGGTRDANVGNGKFQVQFKPCDWIRSTGGMPANCNTDAPGLLPEGSNLVTAGADANDDGYKFAYLEQQDTGATQRVFGYGFVRRNVTGDVDPSPAPPSGRTGVLDGEYRKVSKPVVTAIAGCTPGVESGTCEQSDLFQGGWIDTRTFRNFAQARIDDNATCPPFVPLANCTSAMLGDNANPATVNPYLQHDSFDPTYINQAHYIAAKVYALGAIVGLASLEDKYRLPGNTAVPNPDSPFTSPAADLNFHAFNGAPLRGYDLLKKVADLNRYPHRCTNTTPNTNQNDPDTGAVDARPNRITYLSLPPSGVLPRGLDIFGGLYARYINIGSTNGLCVYRDDRDVDLGPVPILVMPGPAYREDPLASN